MGGGEVQFFPQRGVQLLFPVFPLETLVTSNFPGWGLEPLDLHMANNANNIQTGFKKSYVGHFFKFIELIDLLKSVKVNTYIVYIFGMIELLSINAI